MYAKEVPCRYFSQQWACLVCVRTHTHTESGIHLLPSTHSDILCAGDADLDIHTDTHTHTMHTIKNTLLLSFIHPDARSHARAFCTFSNRRVSPSGTLTQSTQIPTHSHPRSVTHTCTHIHTLIHLLKAMHSHAYTSLHNKPNAHTVDTHRHPKPCFLGCPPFLKAKAPGSRSLAVFRRAEMGHTPLDLPTLTPSSPEASWREQAEPGPAP